jgi:regulator of sirC expression with transglutaminase-like and TPR domain
MMQLSLARQRFIQEVRQPDEYIDVERAALYIAQEAYPDLDVEEYVAALDGMAEEVRERLPQEEYPLRTIKVINQYLFEDLKFHGNQSNYYDPRNSFFNDVIDRRTGIPISLALVYLSIAQRIAFPMVGVGMPGHFLIRPAGGEVEFLIDAFHRGEILFPQDCEVRLRQMFGGQLAMRSEFLAPVSNRQFLARMLTNLKAIYLSQGAIEPVLSTVERILILFPEAPIELRDRGLIYYRMNRWIEARTDLETYLEVQPKADDRDVITAVLGQIAEQRT